jgi:hypothetical protein
MKIHLNNLDNHKPEKTWNGTTFKSIQFSNIDWSPLKGYDIVRIFNTCRGYIGQSLYDLKTNRVTTPSVLAFSSKKFKYKTGLTYVAIRFNEQDIEKKIFLLEKSLQWLNSLEEQTKVKLSTIATTQDPDIFVVIGDGNWKNSCWKLMLYTFLIKCMYYKVPGQCNPEYWKQLNRKNPKTKISNLDQLLSKVDTSWKKEIFSTTVYGNDLKNMTHYHNGFEAICKGANPPMAKLLGVTV